MQGVRVLAPLPGRDAAGVDCLDAVRFRRPDQPRDDVLGALGLAGLEEIHHDLVVRHQHERRLVHERDVVQFLVRVSGRQHGHGRFVDRRPSHPGIEIARGERRRRHAAEAGAAIGAVQELARGALIFGNEASREVEGPAGHVGVDVDAAGKHDHPARVERSRALGVGDDLAVSDADVANDAVDPVGRVVNFPAGDADHEIG